MICHVLFGVVMRLRQTLCCMLLLAMFLPVALYANDNLLDGRLNQDIYLIEKYADNPSSHNKDRLSAYNLSCESDPKLKVFLYFDTQPNISTAMELTEFGVVLFPETWVPPIGSHKSGFMIARASVSDIRQIAKRKLATRISAAYRELLPMNDLTAEGTGAASARELDPPLRGEGVRLAILDSGYDFTHPDLPDPALSMDYADYPDTNENVTDQISGHGTHVAGTAFGSGELSDGLYKGMAPDVEPIYLKVGDDSTGYASAAAVVGALKGAATWCEADILSMSYGGWDGFNDGSSPEEQALDWAVGEGTTAFISAGNYGSLWNHYYGSVAGNDTTALIRAFRNFAVEQMYWTLYMIWYDGSDPDVHRELSFRILDGDGNQIGYDELDQVTSPRGAEMLQLLPADPIPVNGKSYYIEVVNESDEDQTFHLWTFNTTYLPVAFEEVNRDYSVILPATADSAVAVGAYATRLDWTDYTGEYHEDNNVLDSLAFFSSKGPRLDGLRKPDIVGPGQRTISSRDRNIHLLNEFYAWQLISNNGGAGEPADYIVMMGTSMSCPATAGTAALILQADPDLSSAELRQKIFQSARTDQYTGEVPNLHWGWGKIDVISALDVKDDITPVNFPISIEITSYYPNPFNSYITVNFIVANSIDVQVTLHDVSGRRLWSDTYAAKRGMNSYTSDSFASIPSGKYILSIADNNGFGSAQITMIK